MLQRLDDGLWTATGPFSNGGIQMGVRMTALQLADGGILLHSPIQHDPELQRAVEAAGPIRHLVAPNKLHHLYLKEWVEAVPEARLWGPVGLPDKRTDLVFHGVLTDEPDPGWADSVDQLQFLGAPYTTEVVFLHKPTRTLVLTDLAFHVTGPVNLPTRLYLRIGRCHGRLKTTALMRFFVRDKRAARESVERMLGWDFDRIVVSHGEVLEHGGPDALREAFEWL